MTAGRSPGAGGPMGYVDKNLLPGEEILLRPRYHPVRFLPGALGVLLGGLIAVGAFVLLPGAASPFLFGAAGAAIVVAGLVVIAFRAFVDSFDEFAITSVRIIRKTGILTRRVSQIPLDKVQDLSLVATFWGRQLSYGDVEVQSAAEEGPVAFRRIRNPEAFRNVVLARRAPPVVVPGAPSPRLRTAEERLADVERLFKGGTLSEAEYKAKRQELIREL
ncbi:MAG: PH domain-containing protein [Thermoanaerobaculia bacterium]